MVQLTKKDWNHVKLISQENLKGAIIGKKVAEMQILLAEREMARLPEEKEEPPEENKAVK